MNFYNMDFHQRRASLLKPFLVAGFVLLASVWPAAAGVTVYAEGAYTDSDLVVYIYADIDDAAVCSAGVKLAYNSSVLTMTHAEKNEAVWFFGNGSTNYPYMNPKDVGDGVIFICGKLDSNNPTAGVSGNRVLLGKVTFNIKGAPINTPVANPESYFGISLGLGRGGDFANFVTVTGTEIDDSVDFVSKGIIVRERGDANADGLITNSDFIAIRNLMNDNIYKVYADCNNDNVVTNSDFICVRNKI